jgi:hypothetical protein
VLLRSGGDDRSAITTAPNHTAADGGGAGFADEEAIAMEAKFAGVGGVRDCRNCSGGDLCEYDGAAGDAADVGTLSEVVSRPYIEEVGWGGTFMDAEAIGH